MAQLLGDLPKIGDFPMWKKNTGPIYNNCLPTLKEDVDGFLEVSTD